MRHFNPTASLTALTLCLGASLAVTALLPPRRAASDAAPAPAPPVSPEAATFFEERVRPVLWENCVGCHGPDAQMGGLRLDSREAILKGGDTGASLSPGAPDQSLLISAVRHAGKLKMPQGSKLKPEQIAALETWVKMGAPWPAASSSKPGAGKPWNGGSSAPKHWAFRPVQAPRLPAVKDAAWAKDSPIDRFVLARLEAKKLRPAPEADKRTLIRRVTFDLTGLPPTPQEVASFLADRRPDAYERLVDRLLASPRYGERWARLWLDIARYADTKGYVFQEDRNFPNAYTYRDWVIQSFNSDLPYDKFITYQLAADRLPLGEDKTPLAALGFLTVGRRFLNQQPDIINDRIDVTTRGMLGLTVACARCHDHKFDPVPTQDYYSLYGIFAATKETAPQISPAGRQPVQVAMAMEDSEAHPAPARIFRRGDPNKPGDEAPRRFLLALSPSGKDRPVWTEGSGRLELARAIASPDNPLTARVLVNRVWQNHFGAGIVRTPSDFGRQGEPPTHPELLDWLALRFVKSGWSVKKLHRTILLSNTYRQSSQLNEKAFAIDPEDRLLWRQSRRRLDLEQTRDALLSAAGRLDLSRVGGPSEELWTMTPSLRRAVYGRVERQNLPATFRTFDFASPDASTPVRFHTTVPQQALFFLNSPFAAEQARTLSARPEVAKAANDPERVRALYRLLFARAPLPDELELGVRFLKQSSTPTTAAGADDPSRTWRYGWGAFDEATQRVTGFTPLGHFTGSAYQGGTEMPDPTLRFLQLTAKTGHPGADGAHAIIRRWVAPATATITIGGLLKHDSDKGDGVRGRIVHSRLGLLGTFEAFHGQTRADLKDPVAVQRGDTIDFVVDPKGSDAFDSHQWAVTLTSTGQAKRAWASERDFGGPPPDPLDKTGRYAQALLMTNEFLFVD